MSHNNYPPQGPGRNPFSTEVPAQGVAYPPAYSSWTQGWFAFHDSEYLKGFAIGAGLTFLLTNPKVQRTLVKGAVTLWTTVQGGLEEVKEQIQDVKSEMSMSAHDSKK